MPRRRARRPAAARRALRALPAVAALVAAGAARADLGSETIPAAGGRPEIRLAPRPTAAATLRVAFAVGAADDQGSPGLTSVAQHALLCANAAVAYPELVLSTWAAGARLRTEVGPHQTAFTLTAPAAEFLPLARDLLGALLSPRLAPALFPQAVARAALHAGGGADATAVASAIATGEAGELAPPGGERGTIESLDLVDVQRHVEAAFTPANATVVVTGAFDRAQVLRLLGRYRGGRRRSAPTAALHLPADLQLPGGRDAHVLAQALALRGAADAAAARLAAELVQQAVWRDLRQAGLGYTFEVRVLRGGVVDLLVVVLPASDPTGTELAQRLRGAVEQVREGRFSDAALERARTAALAALAADDADPEALAAALGAGGAAWHGPEVAAALQRLDRAGVLAAAGPWLARDRSAYAWLYAP